MEGTPWVEMTGKTIEGTPWVEMTGIIMEGTPWVGMTGTTMEGNTVDWDDGNINGRVHRGFG